MIDARRDLTGLLLGVLSLGALIIASLWILEPFLVPAVWAATIVITTWPFLIWLQEHLWRRRWIAVIAMMLILLLLFVVPLVIGITTLALHTDDIAAQVKLLAGLRFPSLPNWVASLPVVGEKLVLAWQQATAAGLDGVFAKVTPYAGGFTRWFVARAGNAGLLLVQFFLTLLLSALMYAQGEAAAAGALRFGRRLAGARGESSVLLAGLAIRSVALGVGVTAVVQSVLAGIGLAIVDVPFALALTLVMFVLCIAQVGVLVVMLPAVVWVWWNGATGWAVVLLVWSLVVSMLDNVLRPVLIKRGADMPLLLVFAGVIGGLFAFGLVGIVVGPVLLAVAYTLLNSWIDDGHAGSVPPAAVAPGLVDRPVKDIRR